MKRRNDNHSPGVIRGDDVLMSGKNLFSLFLMKNCAEEEFSVNSNIISVEIRSGK